MTRSAVHTDAFTYSNGALATVGTNWENVYTNFGTVNVSSNLIVGSGVGFGVSTAPMARSTSTYDADQYAVVTISAPAWIDATYGYGVMVRSTGSDATRTFYYAFITQEASPTLRVGRINNGSTTEFDTDSSIGWTNGDTLELEVETSGADALLRVYRNGSLITSIGTAGTYTDSSSPLTSGKPGVLTTDAFEIDNFEGGDLVAAGGSEYSAGGSTGIQNYIGFQASQIGLHRNVQPGIAYFNAQGFAPSTSAGFQIDAATGYANFVGYGAQAIQDEIGIAGRINFNTGTHQTHVTRQFFGLLGQLRALGFLVDQTNSQGFFPSLGNVYFQGPTGATVTVFSAPTTFTANALLRETHFVGFQAQLIRDFFPISANTHALGFTPQYVEFIREISGPTIGETNFSGFAAQAIILGQINDAIAQKGEVNLVGFQHAVDMWRTLDILQGRINMHGFAAGVAVFQGGTVNLAGVTGEINFNTLQQAVGMYRTFYPDSGLTNAEGYVPVPSTGTLVQSLVGILNQEGFIPFIVAERYRGIVGEMRLEGFAPTIGGGLWTPKRRRATSWAAIN